MIKVLIADDHKMVADGFRSLLADLPDVEVVGEVFSGQNVVPFVDRTPVDLVLMDINMPGMNGIEATDALKTKHPSVNVLVVSMHDDPDNIKLMVEKGASGYILKNTGRMELVNAIRQIHDGKNYFSQEVTTSLMSSYRKPAEEVVELTKRELEVLKLLCKANTTHEIAEELFISTHTVETHRKNLLSKLNCRNTVGLVRYAIENGLAD